MSGAPPDDAPDTRPTRPSAFWQTVWLVVILVVVKATYVALSPFWTWATPKDYRSWLFAKWVSGASYEDVLFGVVAGLFASVLILATRKQPRAASIISTAFVAFGAICVAYAIAARQVFSYYAAPLTWPLLALSGEPSKMWSSLTPFITLRVIYWLIAAPVVYVLLVRISRRFESVVEPTARLAVRIALLLLLVVFMQVATGFIRTQPQWFNAQDHHLRDSPHTAMLVSMVGALPGSSSSLTSAESRPGDIREFSAPSASLPVTYPDGWTIPDSVRRPRNVILIVLESVGTQYLSLYGNKLNTTPRLSAEQSNAMVFDKYYAPVAWTAYSLIALTLAKQPPMERYNTISFRTGKLEGQSLPWVLRRAGYNTAFMAAGDPDWASGDFLSRNGFDHIVHGKELAAKAVSSWGTEDRWLFRDMLEWIDNRRDKPFFLMAWTDQTHHPYTVGPDQSLVDLLPGTGGHENPLGRYLSLVRESDTQIGALLDSLRRRGLADSTLVIVTGDHGEAFGKLHGGGGHGFTVYDEEVRVPLMLWNPVLFHGGMHSEEIGSHPDLAPTVLDILGVPPPAGWDGRSLFDKHKPPRAYFFAAAWGEYLLGVREENLKYIYDARAGEQQLFDLTTDPTEQKNLASADTAHAHRLRERLAAWLEVERRSR